MTQLIGQDTAAALAAPQSGSERHPFGRSVARVYAALGRRTAWWPIRQRSESNQALPSVDEMIAACASDRAGEMAARRRTVEVGLMYLQASDASRVEFLQVLADRFGYDGGHVEALFQLALSARDGIERERALVDLSYSLRAPRVDLFRRFSTMPCGIRFLVDLRADVRRFQRKHPSLRPLDDELRALLASLFDLGLLEFERISWSAPAPLLERLIAYEAVHPIAGWTELKNRLDRDRYVFALFHPRMPLDPLTFVEVALTQGPARSLREVLDERSPVYDPDTADTATFYSISSAHDGLAGIPFGNYLISRVVTQLSIELPTLTMFATLSPVPGFRAWLARVAESGDDQPDLPMALGSEVNLAAVSDALSKSKAPDDHTLERLIAYYLIRVKAKDGLALDPVARFHLGNGARLFRINPHADGSAKGWEQSAGVMVNYCYDDMETGANLEAYRSHGRIATGPSIRRLLLG